MQATLTIPEAAVEDNSLERLAEKATAFACESQAKNTLRAYRADWQDFQSWCGKNNLESLPADPRTVQLYLTALSERCKVSTIKRRIASIAHIHLAHGYGSPREHPAVKAVLAGIRRKNGAAQEGKSPILKDDLRAMVESLPLTLTGTRDKAILLVGFFSACRRSELVGLNVEDVLLTMEGAVLGLRKSKTDQEWEGRQIGIPFASNRRLCPVEALKDWLNASRVNSGAIFRAINRYGRVSDRRLCARAVAEIVKASAGAAGLDASKFSAHSLRSGFCTEAALSDVEERLIMKQTGHTTERVVRGYIKEASVFQNNGAAAVEF